MIKRISIFLLGALAMIMAGCSKEPHTAAPGENDWVHDLTLPVPIQFSTAATPATKSAIETADQMVGKNFGFFAVDKAASDLTAPNGLSEIFNNVSAQCALTDNYTEDGRQIVDFSWTTGTSYYYPMTSKINYNFYGYHLWNSGASVTSETRITVPVSYSGKSLWTTDILWGEAVAEPKSPEGSDLVYNGFNAAYVRKIGKPMIDFKHATARVSFKATLAEDPDAKEGVQVDQFKLMNVPSSANLCVVDILDPSLNGTFVDLGEPSESGCPIPGSNLGTLEQGVTAEIATDMFIPPMTESLVVRILYRVVMENGSTGGQQTADYEIDPKLFNASLNGYEAGKHYIFNLKFYSPERIVIDATVQEYENAFDGDGVALVDPDDPSNY